MEAWTLREAAERTSRSVTTLRRYIRSGRLEAVKRPGRFGPEYFVSARGLADAGLTVDLEASPPRALERVRGKGVASPSDPATRGDVVPLALYQELQMKHEQLLVQYGMVRASGLLVFDLRSELEAERSELESSRQLVDQLERELAEQGARLRGELQRLALEHEGTSLENAALREKVRGLEMMTRNARTTESIEWQFREVLEQAHRVERLSADLPREADAVRPRERVEPDH